MKQCYVLTAALRCQAMVGFTTGSYAFEMMVAPSKLSIPPLILIQVVTAIFVLRVYTISASYGNLRRVLIAVATLSHILTVVFLIVGFHYFIRTCKYILTNSMLIRVIG
jgi:hypothetical protein